MTGLLSGILVGCYLTVSLFFVRFWMTARERLFAMFAAAFFILAIQRAALSLTAETLEDQTGFYLLRLLAFLLIVAAIVDKNRR